MRIKSAVFAFLLICLAGSTAFSQDIKIGYTNIELVLAYMPEAKKIEKELGTFQQKLAEQLKVKQEYGEQKQREYLELKEANRLSPEDEERRIKELQGLDQEIKKMASDAEFELLAKRQELLGPVLKSLQSAIDDVAKTNGYTYVLNQTTSAGVSTILYGPDEDDLTEKIMKKLNIEIPKTEGEGGN